MTPTRSTQTCDDMLCQKLKFQIPFVEAKWSPSLPKQCQCSSPPGAQFVLKTTRSCRAGPPFPVTLGSNLENSRCKSPSALATHFLAIYSLTHSSTHSLTFSFQKIKNNVQNFFFTITKFQATTAAQDATCVSSDRLRFVAHDGVESVALASTWSSITTSTNRQ